MVLSTAHLSPLLSIVFGILIWIFPRLLNYLVAAYLTLAGRLGIGLIATPLRAHAQFDRLVPNPEHDQDAEETHQAPEAPTEVVAGQRQVRFTPRYPALNGSRAVDKENAGVQP